MNQEAMKQALCVYLDAFENHRITNSTSSNLDMTGHIAELARTAIEQAEKQEQCKEHGECFGGKCIYTTPPAAPVQEPVAWMMVNPEHLPQSRSLHWEPKTEWHISWQAVPLYTTPPAAQRQWVGLTDKDFPDHDTNYCCMNSDFIAGARWANATLREKNGGGA